MPKVYFIDVTNGDGVQTAKPGLPELRKTLINIHLRGCRLFTNAPVIAREKPEAI